MLMCSKYVQLEVVVFMFGLFFFFFQAEDGIRDVAVTGVQTCALPISRSDAVVGVGTKRHTDRIRTNARDLRRRGRQRIVQRVPVHRPGDRGGQRRVAVAVVFALIVRLHRPRALVHRQGAVARSDAVVGVGTKRHTDRIWTNARELRRRGRQRIVQRVPVHRPGDRGGQRPDAVAVVFALIVRLHRRRALVHRQGAVARSDAVVGVGTKRHTDRIRTNARELRRRGRQRIVQRVPVHRAGDRGGQRRVAVAVVFALIVRLHRRRALVHRQGAVARSDAVVGVGTKRHADRIRTNAGELRRRGRQRIVQRVPVHRPGDRGGQRRVAVAVVFALIVRLHRRRALVHRQGAVARSDAVVGVGTKRHADRIRTNARELRRRGRQRIVQRVPVHRPGDRGGQRRVGVAVVLGFIVRLHRRRALVHRQGAVARSDAVVGVGTKRHTDRIWTNARELQRRGRQRIVQRVPVHRAGDRGGQRRVAVAVVFALIVRLHRRRALVHRQGAVARSDAVVGVQAKRHLDRIRAYAGELRRRGRQRIVQRVPVHRPGDRGGQRRVAVAVVFALIVRLHRRRALVHRQGAVARSDAVVGVGTKRHADRIWTNARELRRRGRQRIVQRVPVHRPGDRGGQRRVFFFNDTATTEIYTLSLHVALPICAVARSDAVVGVGTKRHADRIWTNARELQRRGRQRIVQRVPVHRAGDRGGQRWVAVVVVFALIVRLHRRRALVHRQGAVARSDAVVGVGTKRHTDRIWTNARELHRRGCQRIVQRVPVHRPGDRGGQRRVGVAVVFGFIVRLHRRRSLVHRQGAVARSDAVVGVGTKRHTDRIWTNAGELRRRGRQRIVQRVPVHRPGDRGGQRRVAVAVVFALIVRLHRRRALVHRQGAVARSDSVVEA